jgi:ubiquinone/menaquinone biosynthesis C-methylase UbiE
MAALTPQEKAERTYNFTADFFDDPALGFWDRCGQRTVGLLGLEPGMRVLDVCCGTGASALPAAKAVGNGGRVIGVDLSENLLELAQQKAKALQLGNIEFLKADMTELPFEQESFDAVIIVFGIFFVPDMEEQVRKLWRLVKPGGKLAVTTWGPRFFEPAYTEWRAALAMVTPEWVTDFNPWDRITTVEAVQRLIDEGLAGRDEGIVSDKGMRSDKGIGREVKVVTEECVHKLSAPEDFWRIALGSGLRWAIEQMGESKAKLLKEMLLKRLTERPEGPVRSIETNAIYGIVKKVVDDVPQAPMA